MIHVSCKTESDQNISPSPSLTCNQLSLPAISEPVFLYNPSNAEFVPFNSKPLQSDVGAPVGANVGEYDGANVGAKDGAGDGEDDGAFVGAADVGIAVVGDGVGSLVGIPVA